MHSPNQRANVVDATISNVRQTIAAQGVNRDALATVLHSLVDLAADKNLWTEADFPAPTDGELQARYLIAKDQDDTYALYLNVMRPGKKIVPHDHTTWACIAGRRRHGDQSRLSARRRWLGTWQSGS